MWFNLNKKGDGGLTAIVIIIIIIIFLGWLVNIGSKECDSNNDCGEDNYCGSDFSCHKIPVIEKTVVERSNTLPLLLVCITLVALAIIFRWEKMFSRREVKDFKTKEEMPESYYTSQFQYTAK